MVFQRKLNTTEFIIRGFGIHKNRFLSPFLIHRMFKPLQPSHPLTPKWAESCVYKMARKPQEEWAGSVLCFSSKQAQSKDVATFSWPWFPKLSLRWTIHEPLSVSVPAIPGEQEKTCHLPLPCSAARWGRLSGVSGRRLPPPGPAWATLHIPGSSGKPTVWSSTDHFFLEQEKDYFSQNGWHFSHFWDVTLSIILFTLWGRETL